MISNKKAGLARFLILTIIFGITSSCKGQKAFGNKYLKLQQAIPLPALKGRIDHIGINIKDRIAYIAALGNNSLEVVDLDNGKRIHSIRGLEEPHGVVYIPRSREVMVANGGSGRCYFYNVDTFKKTATVNLSSDADDVRYDSLSGSIYVGYGSGGIAVINADLHKKIHDYPLPGHPEAFEIDKTVHKLFVNVPGADQIDVLDLAISKPVAAWKNALLSFPKANFPMALDPVRHRLFVGYRYPARVVILDTHTDKKITSLKITRDPDDLYYDAHSQRIYISGGGGFINIFEQKTTESFKQIANIPTRARARTSLLVPELHLFLLAEPATGDSEAQLIVYRTNP